MYLNVRKLAASQQSLRKFVCCSCDDNKIRMARKPGKKEKENPVGYTEEAKR